MGREKIKTLFGDIYDKLINKEQLTENEMEMFNGGLEPRILDYCVGARAGGTMRLITEIFLKALIGDGIKVLASDFDGTFIEYQSGGSWDPKHDDKRFLTSVTSDVRELFMHWQCLGLTIVIVTYSDAAAFQRRGRISGADMIDAVMTHSKPQFRIEKIYAYWPPYWNSEQRYKKLGLPKPMPDGKQYHLQLLKQDLNFNDEDIVLLDDDLANCQIAKLNGILALNPYEARGFFMDKLEVYV